MLNKVLKYCHFIYFLAVLSLEQIWFGKIDVRFFFLVDSYLLLRKKNQLKIYIGGLKNLFFALLVHVQK